MEDRSSGVAAISRINVGAFCLNLSQVFMNSWRRGRFLGSIFVNTTYFRAILKFIVAKYGIDLKYEWLSVKIRPWGVFEMNGTDKMHFEFIFYVPDKIHQSCDYSS